MRPSTVLRLGLAGSRTDRLRVGLTAFSAAAAALALLSAATVASIHGGAEVFSSDHLTRTPGSQQYSNALLTEAGLRPGVVIALALLTLPVLALAGQCARLGAPARDRRLAAFRLAGATPRQAVLVATAETAVAALIGSVLGFGVYSVLRVALVWRDGRGRLVLPTDVRPNSVLIVGLLLVVPAVAGLFGAMLLRQVVISPLGVTRRVRGYAPKPWPGLLLVAGVVLMQVPLDLLRDHGWGADWEIATVAAGILAAVAGVLLGTGWISHATGRLLVRYGRRPAALLAGRRLTDDPWNGSRTMAALLAALLCGAFAVGYRAMMVAGFAIGPDAFGDSRAFYLNAVHLVVVATVVGLLIAAAGLVVAQVEGVVSRRRTYAALTAVGVPRRVLAEALLWQSVAPMIPAIAVTLAAGTHIERLLYGDDITRNGVLWTIPVGYGSLLLLGAAAVGALLLVTAAGIAALRSSTDLSELRV